MTFVNHMWWRRWVCTCRLNRNQLAIFYNPSIVLRLEDGLAACFICCSKTFALGGSNFSSVDVLILFQNVLSLSVSISQPSKLSLFLKYEFTRSCCAWSYTSIQPTLYASKEWIADHISSADNMNKWQCPKVFMTHCSGKNSWMDSCLEMNDQSSNIQCNVCNRN